MHPETSSRNGYLSLSVYGILGLTSTFDFVSSSPYPVALSPILLRQSSALRQSQSELRALHTNDDSQNNNNNNNEASQKSSKQQRLEARAAERRRRRLLAEAEDLRQSARESYPGDEFYQGTFMLCIYIF